MNLAQLQPEIQAYLDQAQSPEQRAAFEALLATSTELKQAVNEYRRLRIMHQNEALIQANAQLRQIMADTTLPQPEPGIPKKGPFTGGMGVLWLVGIVLASLLGSGGWWAWQQHTQKQALEQRIQQVLEPLENYIGFAADDMSTAALAMRAYDSKDYAAAIPYFNDALDTQPNDHSLKLYLAISQLMQQRWPSAKILLKEIAQTDDLAAVPAQWYLALCHLHDGEKAAAQPILEGLRTDPVFGPRAAQLLSNPPTSSNPPL